MRINHLLFGGIDLLARAHRAATTSMVALACVALATPSMAIDVDLFQIDWADNAGGFIAQDSAHGRVELAFTAADDSLFFDQTDAEARGGFINVVTRQSGDTGAGNWAVQNVPIFYDDPAELGERLAEGLHFDLGVTAGTDVPTLDFYVDVSATALGGMPAGTFANGSVGAFEWLVGGESYREFGQLFDGTTGQAAPPTPVDFVSVEGNGKVRPSGTVTNAATNVPPINEGQNGCAPGAVARSLQYMSNIHDHMHVPRTAQQTYNDLVTDMGTVIGNPGGTATANILTGKNTFVARHRLPIVSAQHNSFAKAIKTLRKGGDVEIGVRWGTNGAGMNLGSHRAFVSQIRPITNGVGDLAGYSVTVIDDRQNNGMAENRSYRMTFDVNGRMTGNPVSGAMGGSLINFQTQHVFRYVVGKRGIRRVPLRVQGEGSSVVIETEGGFGGPERTTSDIVLTQQQVINLDNPTAPAPLMAMDTIVDPVTQESFRTEIIPLNLSSENPLPNQVLFNFQLDIIDPQTQQPFLIDDQAPEEPGPFLVNFQPGMSIFDITIHTQPDPLLADKEVYQLHGEIDPNLVQSMWFADMQLQPVDPQNPSTQYQMQLVLQSEQPFDMEAPIFSITQSAVALPDPFLGDLNGDGVVDGFDVDPFVHLLTNGIDSFLQQFPDAPFPLFTADFTDDGVVDGFDVGQFVDLLTGAGVEVGALAGLGVPEPSSLALGCLCVLACWVRWGRARR